MEVSQTVPTAADADVIRRRAGLRCESCTYHVIASISLAFTLAPVLFSSNVHRSKPWYSMITSMMIFPLLYLLNVGSQFDYEDAPPIGLCILQAGFIYAGAFLFALVLGWVLISV